ncbi:MAG TPA: TonB-dependent receptor [Thermoanaerobaculia bacterium]|jgi:outer membrane receptor protein involved in Fe transport|nr:TonB-dependent receptor [Thermoanaerobaculia bacterium]
MKNRVAPLLLLLALPLKAEEPPAPPPYREEIVVTAPKTPVAVEDTPSALTVLTAEDIALAGATTLPTLLLKAGGGFHVYDPTATGTGAVVDLRGFYSAGETSYVLLSIDGLAANNVDTDVVDWNLVDLERVQRIEVLRGPVSTLYGNVGMSGLINVVTHRPRPGTDGTIVLGTGNGGEGEGSLAASWARERKEAAISLRRVTLSGFREHSVYHSTQAQSTLRWAPRLPGSPGAGAADTAGTAGNAGNASRELGLALTGLYLDSDREIPGAIPRGTPSREAGSPLDADLARTWQAGLSLSLPLSGTSHFEAAASVRGKDQYRVDTVAFQTFAHGLGTRTGRGEVRYRRGFALAGHGGRLLAGVEASEGRVDSEYFRINAVGVLNSRFDHARATRTTLGSFATAEVDLGRDLALSAGVRYDELHGAFDGKVPLPDTAFTATSPSLALNWHLGETGNAFLSASRSFKAPTVEQLYDRRPFIISRGVSVFLSNTALLPQRATNYEAGVRTLLGGHATAALSLYSLRITDEIGFDFSHLRFDNISRSRHQGVEWSLTGDLSPGLRPRLSYTYSRAVFDGGENDGHQINGVPRTQIAASLGWIGYTHGGTGPFGEIDLTHVRGQFIDEENRLPLDPYTLVGVVLGVRFEKLSFDVTARNLLNRRYSPDGFVTLDTRGRALALYYPGTERTVTARVRIDF